MDSRIAPLPVWLSNSITMKRTAQFATLVALSLILPGCHQTSQESVKAEVPLPTPSPSPASLTKATPVKEIEPTLLPGPNAVPRDTRVVINIPAFRMDVFEDGASIKSYRVGIGYPKYPLPTGLRKAELVIINPTWTPPHSPWVNAMNATPGEIVGAGSKHNPLGPIKVPLGEATLIHGGKPLSKIGTFASHGCVGMTNAQVKDFAKVLLQASDTELSDETLTAYLNKRTRTRVVNLTKLVPIELRYETIVLEDGVLHIYRDVYAQNTNTEIKLREVLETNGLKFDELSSDGKTQILEALNAMSLHPGKQAEPKPSPPDLQSSANMNTNANEKRAAAERQRKLRDQKEIAIEISALSGKGYPAPMSLDTGAGVETKARPSPSVSAP